MKYKWKEKELDSIIERLKDKEDISNIHLMKELIHGETSLKDFGEDVYDENRSFSERKEFYNLYSDVISPEYVDFAKSIFSIEKEPDKLFLEMDYTPYKIPNQLLVEYAYEILKTLDDKEVMAVFDEVCATKNHFLNIMDSSNQNTGMTSELGGLTFPVYTDHKSYLTIFRTYTTHDIMALVHEIMHCVRFRIFKEDPTKLYYFDELEGKFGNRLTYNYMINKEHDLLGYELLASEYFTIMRQSYFLLLNEVLYETSKDSHYRIKAFNQELQNIGINSKTRFNSDDIPVITATRKFQSTMDIIEYLIILELYSKYHDPIEEYQAMLYLKSMDSQEYIHEQLPDDFDFFTDNLKVLKKQRKSIMKNIKIY